MNWFETWETVKIVLGVIVITVMALGFLARKNPHIRWLQAFNLGKGLTDQQRERMRKAANRNAGLQFILLGIVIPLGYLALKVMLFSEIPPLEIAVVAVVSILCIGLGITALVNNR